MKNIAYLRVSKKDDQDTNNQKLAILDYAQKNGFMVDEFIEISISSRKDTKKRRIDELLENVKSGDRIIVSELSRLGRSVGQIAMIVDALIKSDVSLTCLKENIRINGNMDISTKVQVSMFSLFAEIERDLISQRTKEGLEAAKEKGHFGGRPTGKGKSKLDAHKAEIEQMLDMGVPKSKIAEKFGVERPTLYNFIKYLNK